MCSSSKEQLLTAHLAEVEKQHQLHVRSATTSEAGATSSCGPLRGIQEEVHNGRPCLCDRHMTGDTTRSATLWPMHQSRRWAAAMTCRSSAAVVVLSRKLLVRDYYGIHAQQACVILLLLTAVEASLAAAMTMRQTNECRVNLRLLIICTHVTAWQLTAILGAQPCTEWF
jgi:hypothetical protein